MSLLTSQLAEILITEQSVVSTWAYFAFILEIPQPTYSSLNKKYKENNITVCELFTFTLDVWLKRNVSSTVSQLTTILRNGDLLTHADILENHFDKLATIAPSKPSLLPLPFANLEQPEHDFQRVPYWHNMTKPCPNFTGREKELSAMRKHFGLSFFDTICSKPSSKFLHILGPHSIGKTELVRKFAVEFHEHWNYRRSCIWIDDESSFENFLCKNGITSMGQLGRLQNTMRYLIVFDNVANVQETLREFNKLPPEQEPFVIIISRVKSPLNCPRIQLQVRPGDELRFIVQLFKYEITPWVLENGGDSSVCDKINQMWHLLFSRESDSLNLVFAFYLLHLIVSLVQDVNYSIVETGAFVNTKNPIFKSVRLFYDAGLFKTAYSTVNASESIAPTIKIFLSHPSLKFVYNRFDSLSQINILRWLLGVMAKKPETDLSAINNVNFDSLFKEVLSLKNIEILQQEMKIVDTCYYKTLKIETLKEIYEASLKLEYPLMKICRIYACKLMEEGDFENSYEVFKWLCVNVRNPTDGDHAVRCLYALDRPNAAEKLKRELRKPLCLLQ